MILVQELHQTIHREHVDAHRGERVIGIARNGRRRLRLLVKGHDPVVLIRGHHAEGSCLVETDRQAGNGHIGSRVAVALQHRGIVHPVDVISRENQRVLGAASLQQVEVLVDGVRGSLVPRFARPHLRRDQRDVLAQLGVVDGPPVAQVLLQRIGLVLRQHENAAQSGMQAVAEREIDDAIPSRRRARPAWPARRSADGGANRPRPPG